MCNTEHLPEGLGLIMDGNGRWAETKGLPRKEGHTAGIVNMIRLSLHAFERGVKNVVCYSLSAENLQRKKEELDHILSLVPTYQETFRRVFREHRVCVRIAGDLELLPEDVRESLKQTEAALSELETSGRTLYIAIAYGSRREIVGAVNRAVALGTSVTEASFLSMLDLPMDLDLIVRTGGEQRLSNFFLYQSSYAELFFSDRYFPDFSEADLDGALAWFSARSRRYGR